MDACASRRWKDIEQHADSGCWVLLGDGPSQELPPPHTPGCVGTAFVHIIARRRATGRPKPQAQTLNPKRHRFFIPGWLRGMIRYNVGSRRYTYGYKIVVMLVIVL